MIDLIASVSAHVAVIVVEIGSLLRGCLDVSEFATAVEGGVRLRRGVGPASPGYLLSRNFAAMTLAIIGTKQK